MANTPEENFQNYKRCEAKALEIVQTLKEESSKVEDIEIALLTAIFELHRGTLMPQHVSKIVNGHTENLAAYYTQQIANNN